MSITELYYGCAQILEKGGISMKEKCCNDKHDHKHEHSHNHEHNHNCSSENRGKKGKDTDLLLTDVHKLEERKSCLQERIDNINTRIEELKNNS